MCIITIFDHLLQFPNSSLDLALAVAFRIPIVPGNFTQRPWRVEKMTSITFREKAERMFDF